MNVYGGKLYRTQLYMSSKMEQIKMNTPETK